MNTSRDLVHANGILTEDEVRSVAPSVFATHRNENRTSQRYSFLSTAEIIKPLQAEGWNIVGVNTTRSRYAGPAEIGGGFGFARHMVVLAHSSDLQNYSYSKVCPRVILTNSHDGSSACKLQAGLFRAACANGLIIADGTVQSQVIRHSHTTIERAILAAIYLRDQSLNAINRVEAFSARELDYSEQIGFAARAIGIRYGHEKVGARPADVLRARREEDEGNDLWRTFNRVQENIVRGGFEVVRPKLGCQERTEVSRQRAKQITAIDALLGVNTKLWAAAEDLVLPA
jgi:uncharacterized protein DUF932